MRHLKLLSTATAATLLLSACNRGPDPAQIEREQRLARENAQLQQQLRDAAVANAATQQQVAKIQTELDASRAAAATAASAQPVATGPSADASSGAVAASPAPASTDAASPLVTIEKEPAASLKPSGADESETLQPGWIVEVFPMKYESDGQRRRYNRDDLTEWRNFQPPESFSLGSFVNAPSPIKLLQHRKHTAGENHVQYVGSAFFTVQNRGDHVFVLTLADLSRTESNDTTAVCSVKLTLEGHDIVSDHIRLTPGRELSATGGYHLIEGLYKAGINVTCPYVGPRSNRPDLSGLEEVALTIAVRRPGEPSPVQLTERDLVYVAKK